MKSSKRVWLPVLVAVLVACPASAQKEEKPKKQTAPVRQGQAPKAPPGSPQAPKVSPPQVRQTETPKPPPQQWRQVEAPKPPPRQVEQAEPPRKRETQQTHPQKGQAHQTPDHQVKSQPEKNQPRRDPDRLPAAQSKIEREPSHVRAPERKPAATPGQPKKRKEVQVHARQPSNTLKPEHTPLIRPERPQFKLTEVKKPGGTVERVSPSNKVRERTVVDKKAGHERTQQLGVTGRIETEEVKRRDGSRQVTKYDFGREKKIQVVRKDGGIETTDVHYSRNGEPRARETIVRDSRGRAVSKTVIVQPSLVVRNTTIVNNATTIRHYSPCRYGFVYRPIAYAPIVYASWYDPYWYGHSGYVVHYRPFRYSWSWSWSWYHEPWFSCHTYYWNPYPVYPAPCYWLTDWLVACYITDRYAAAASAEQAREEARTAREEAQKAYIAAEEARDQAEIAEARAAVAAAEARAERAEARAAKAELEEARAKELAGKPNPKATPIDKETKDALKDQVERTIAEKKAFAEQSAKGVNPVSSDVTASLANPKHIFPVSKTISVIRAEDSKPAGILTAGDLLRAEPGQEKLIAEADENTPITVRVITSKGEDESVPAGTLVAIPLKELQEFDNEFRAKVDLGLTEANNNKELFKKEAVN